MGKRERPLEREGLGGAAAAVPGQREGMWAGDSATTDARAGSLAVPCPRMSEEAVCPLGLGGPTGGWSRFY